VSLSVSPALGASARTLAIRARALAWLSYVCLLVAGASALTAIWLPVMWLAVTFASVGLALMVLAVVLLLADRRAPRTRIAHVHRAPGASGGASGS
jgi:hypothetical protein